MYIYIYIWIFGSFMIVSCFYFFSILHSCYFRRSQSADAHEGHPNIPDGSMVYDVLYAAFGGSNMFKPSILVGGLEQEFYDFHIYNGNIIIPTDELIFFRGVGQPTIFDFNDTSKIIHGMALSWPT